MAESKLTTNIPRMPPKRRKLNNWVTGTFNTKDFRDIERFLKDGMDDVLAAVEYAIWQETKDALQLIKDKYVPVSPGGGTLRETGRIMEVTASKNGLEIVFGFGGVRYAWAVHEHIEGGGSPYDPEVWTNAIVFGKGYIKWTKPKPAGPKFVERGFNAAMRGFQRRVVLLADNFLKGQA